MGGCCPGSGVRLMISLTEVSWCHSVGRWPGAVRYRIVFTRPRVDPRTQDYYERRIKEGKTRREIVRCLKRYAAREVFHLVKQLQPDPRS